MNIYHLLKIVLYPTSSTILLDAFRKENDWFVDNNRYRSLSNEFLMTRSSLVMDAELKFHGLQINDCSCTILFL